MVRTLLVPALVTALLLGAGCSSGGSEPRAEDTISREAFMDAYHELRAAALSTPSQEIPAQLRDRILREQGLTPEDLLHFVEIRGDDPAYMESIWDEIEERMVNQRTGPEQEDRQGDEPEGGSLPQRPGNRGVPRGPGIPQ